MKSIQKILCVLAAVLPLFAATSCSGEGEGPEPSYPKGTHLRLRLEMPPAVRSDDSHPDWPAFESENRVNNITVFFFNDRNGVNGNPDTRFFYSLYIDRGFVLGRDYLTVDVPLDQEYILSQGDRITVTVNMGDLTRLTTLGALQEYIPNATWQTTSTMPSGCHSFTMASAFDNDGLMEVVSDGVHTYYAAEVSVERTAARIDLVYDNASQEKEGGYIEFESRRPGSAETNGYVRLYGAVPVNAMQHPSYALKRISNGLSEDYSCFDSWHYTGTLSLGNGRPKAYLIEPRTRLKTSDAGVPDDWYAETSSARRNAARWEDTNGKNIWSILSDDKIKFATEEGKRGLVLSYINENTQHYTQHSSKWLTGLLMRAVFVPATVYKDVNLTVDDRYVPGSTFWLYRRSDVSTNGDNVIYFSNPEAAYAYSFTHPQEHGRVVEYLMGQCFYHLWLRHTVENRDPQIVFPMEYGIVRNHIYRVIPAFRGIGDPTPNLEEPENAIFSIYVRPWNVFRHDTIII